MNIQPTDMAVWNDSKFVCVYGLPQLVYNTPKYMCIQYIYIHVFSKCAYCLVMIALLSSKSNQRLVWD